jgi:hypothetical protein
MKALPTLLRLARRDLDLLRRALAEEEAGRAAVENRMALQAQSVQAEQAAALLNYDGARAYGGFAAVATAQKRALEAEAAAHEAEATRLRALIVAAHQEARKLERLMELRAEREEAEARQREVMEMDELATLRRK